MMALIALAVLVAYGYSAAVVFGPRGSVFFWELATLIDIMLLGHWIEMRSVMAASGALEELVKLMPAEAHRVKNGSVEEVPVTDLNRGDRALIKPSEKIPTDGRTVEGRTTVTEAMLTGESKPVEKTEGDSVIGAERSTARLPSLSKSRRLGTKPICPRPSKWSAWLRSHGPVPRIWRTARPSG